MTTKKTVLVTGANKGIGREIARQLGAQGHTIWLGCRDEGRGGQAEAELRAEGVDAHFVPLDVTDDASVRLAAEAIESVSAALDVLINNVGIGDGLALQASEESVDGMRSMFETNLFGTIRVTQAFLPLLRRSKVRGSST